MKKRLITLLVILFMSSQSFAAGFGLYEFGARASALGGATVARAWDASTVFYNPAGLSFIEGTHFYGGVTLISPENHFVGAEPILTGQEHSAKDQIFNPIGIYLTHRFSDKFAAGIGVTNPFGLGLEWEEDFPGRGIARNTDLQSFYISPVVSYKVMDNLSVGGGLDLVYSNVLLERSAYLFESEGSSGYEVGTSKLEGSSGIGIGFSASLMYQTERLGLGFLYRHSVTNEFEEGDATFEIYDTYASPLASQLLTDQKASTEMTYPNFFSVGVYYRILDALGVEVDFMWYNWSVFDELVLDFKDDRLDQVVPENYEDASQLRVGVHYDVTSALQIRAGYIYDQTPQPIESVSPLLPDNDRNDYSIGLGYTYNNLQFDLGYMLVDFGERSTVEDGEGQNEYGFDGTYSSLANLFFFSFGIGL
ncbi:MAG: hypothetical protein GF313_16670 [Caldithrix sp.]|nr:hypothetical protein [Caldithrix sp.]